MNNHKRVGEWCDKYVVATRLAQDSVWADAGRLNTVLR